MTPGSPRSKRIAIALSMAIAMCAAVLFPSAASADVVTVGTVTANSSTVDVPVFIRDLAGTPLGVDRPAGSKIQSFSIKVTYAPAAAVQSVTFSRAGITAGLTPTSEFAPASSGSVALLDTFQESTNPIPFTLNGFPPGDQVAHLVFTLSSSATPGTTISLTLDPSLTQLSDAGGTAATTETVSKGTLSLVDGAIDITPLTVSLSPSSRIVPLGGAAPLTVTLSTRATSSTFVTISSSNPAVAAVPSSVAISAGASSADFSVVGSSLGGATITASLGSSSATASVEVADVPAPCNAPSVPQLSAPPSAGIGVAYTVSWNAVGSATEYLLDESTDAAFASVTTKTVLTTSATFTHTNGGARYYYRVRARNHAGDCDLTSGFSTAASVLIDSAPVQAKAVLPVVGSVPGNFGSYFRTSLQLYNPKSTSISGRIVFHPANASASAGDPTLAYSIAARKTLSFVDLLPAMSVVSGLGSADIVADVSSSLPVAIARVFSDGGTAGTTGFAEEAMSTEQALASGSGGVLLAPADVSKFRLNIGVRTLDSGAVVKITVRDRDGAVATTVTKTFAASFFTQSAASAMLDGFTLLGGETLTFDVTSGSAIFYGSTTDNTTNDPSVQIARRLE